MFVFLEILFAEHIETVCAIDSQAFITIMDSVCNGVSSFSSEVVIACSRILTRVASYLYLNQYKNTPTIANIKRIIVAQPNFWSVVLTSVLNAFVFGAASTLWELSKPIYAVCLVDQQAFGQYIKAVSENQDSIVQMQLMEDSNNLMSSLDYAMSKQSMDNFSKMAVAWRRQYLSYMKLWCVCWRKKGSGGEKEREWRGERKGVEGRKRMEERKNRGLIKDLELQCLIVLTMFRNHKRLFSNFILPVLTLQSTSTT